MRLGFVSGPGTFMNSSGPNGLGLPSLPERRCRRFTPWGSPYGDDRRDSSGAMTTRPTIALTGGVLACAALLVVSFSLTSARAAIEHVTRR